MPSVPNAVTRRPYHSPPRTRRTSHRKPVFSATTTPARTRAPWQSRGALPDSPGTLKIAMRFPLLTFPQCELPRMVLMMKTTDNAHAHELMRVQRLIEAAAKATGGQNKLAERLGHTKGEVSGWKTGARACPVKAQTLMADIAGLDARAVTLQAVVDTESNPERKESLLRVLGKHLAPVGAAGFFVLFVGTMAYPPAEASPSQRDTMCRMVKRWPHRRRASVMRKTHQSARSV